MPPAPTRRTRVLESWSCNSGPKMALAWAVRALAVDIVISTREKDENNVVL